MFNLKSWQIYLSYIIGIVLGFYIDIILGCVMLFCSVLSVLSIKNSIHQYEKIHKRNI